MVVVLFILICALALYREEVKHAEPHWYESVAEFLDYCDNYGLNKAISKRRFARD